MPKKKFPENLLLNEDRPLHTTYRCSKNSLLDTLLEWNIFRMKIFLLKPSYRPSEIFVSALLSPNANFFQVYLLNVL